MSFELGGETHTQLFKLSLEDAIKRLAGFGFRYLKISATPPHIWPRGFDKEQRQGIRDLLDSLGMELLGVNPSSLDLNLASTNPAIREETIVQVKELIDLVKDLGGWVVETAGGRVHNLHAPPYEDSWQVVKESLTRCVEYAEAQGITIGLENVPGRFLATAEEMKRMVEEVGSDHLRVMYDVGNGHITEEEPLSQALKEVGDYLVYLHISDNDGKTFAHLPVGEGNIDYGAVTEALREIGFDGVAIMEYPQDPEESFLKSIELLERFGWHL